MSHAASKNSKNSLNSKKEKNTKQSMPFFIVSLRDQKHIRSVQLAIFHKTASALFFFIRADGSQVKQ